MGCLRLSLPNLPEAVSFNICCRNLFHLLSMGLFSDLVLQVAVLNVNTRDRKGEDLKIFSHWNQPNIEYRRLTHSCQQCYIRWNIIHIKPPPFSFSIWQNKYICYFGCSWPSHNLSINLYPKFKYQITILYANICLLDPGPIFVLPCKFLVFLWLKSREW